MGAFTDLAMQESSTALSTRDLHLNFSHNKFSGIPEDLRFIQSLKEMYLNDNSMGEFPIWGNLLYDPAVSAYLYNMIYNDNEPLSCFWTAFDVPHLRPPTWP